MGLFRASPHYQNKIHMACLLGCIVHQWFVGAICQQRNTVRSDDQVERQAALPTNRFDCVVVSDAVYLLTSGPSNAISITTLAEDENLSHTLIPQGHSSVST